MLYTGFMAETTCNQEYLRSVRYNRKAKKTGRIATHSQKT